MRILIATAVISALAGCSVDTSVAQQRSLPTSPLLHSIVRPQAFTKGTISHVVIIFQENRSTDNLFHGLAGADIASSGINSAGQTVPLQPVALTAPYDLEHGRDGFAIEYDNGKLDSFNLEKRTICQGAGCLPTYVAAYGYVPPAQVAPYFDMARQYAFADRMFQSNQGPSFPAHQYIVSGTSTISTDSSLRASENPRTPQQGDTGGCDSPAGSLGALIDTKGEELMQAYPCFDRPALTDLVDAKGLTWHYYVGAVTPGFWNPLDAISHVRNSREYTADVVAPPSAVLTDIAAGNLANVVWVTPTAQASDHAKINNGTGPSWVASVVNAIGQSKYWDNTAIFVTWDDWGGWYDHVPPPAYNSYELGFRVPAIVISAYTPRGYVSHVQHEFGSILKFTEKALGLGTLGATDVRGDDFADCFNFGKPPRPFKAISAPLGARYFLKQPISNEDPDNDW